MRSIGIQLVAVVASGVMLLTPWIPLGVPDEWLWPRLELPASLAEWLDRLLSPVLIAGALVAFCRFVDCRIVRFSRVRRHLMLGVLVMGAFCWINAVRQAAPSPHRELRPLWVLYDKYASGYFYEAAFGTSSQAELLSTYESRMARGDSLHEGTHPPGLLLLNWWALKATAGSETLTAFAEWTQPVSTISVFRRLEAEAMLARRLSRTETAALCLISFLSTLLTAMTVIPVFGIVSLLSEPRTGWRAATLMITVPTISVFAPRSDVVYAFSATLLLWMMIVGCRSPSAPVRWLGSLLAGAVAFVGLTISLAHLPVIVAGMAFAGLSLFGPERLTATRIASAALLMISMFSGLCVIWVLLTDCNLITVWKLNLLNHAGFYDQYSRSWWKWALVNPIELAVAVGLPVTLWSVCGIIRCLESLYRRDHCLGRESAAPIRLTLALIGTWIVLWLSGKNMGEAARLWGFLTPWFVISATFGLSWCRRASLGIGLSQGASGSSTAVRGSREELAWAAGDYQRDWLLLVVAQQIVCTITVGRVSGYLEL